MFNTSFSLTNLKSNDTSTCLLRKVSKVLFEEGLIWVANLVPILAKNSFNLLHISFLSLITLESTMILSSVFRFVFDLRMMSIYSWTHEDYFSIYCIRNFVYYNVLTLNTLHSWFQYIGIIPKDIHLLFLCLSLWNFSNLYGKCLSFICAIYMVLKNIITRIGIGG